MSFHSDTVVQAHKPLKLTTLIRFQVMLDPSTEFNFSNFILFYFSRIPSQEEWHHIGVRGLSGDVGVGGNDHVTKHNTRSQAVRKPNNEVYCDIT